MEQIAQI